MRLRILPKDKLSLGQCQYLDKRLVLPEHQIDRGPIQIWHQYQSYLYAFVHDELSMPIAISEASGRPIAAPGWWIDYKFRGQGYGNELVDLLAEFLATDGVTSIRPIPIDTKNGTYNEQSKKLAIRLRARFAEVIAVSRL
jgi:RimJ/RimL family protein N-acetyltransferase